MRQSELLQLAVNSLPIVLWTADLDGVVTMAEGKALEALGPNFSRDGIVGANLFEMFAHEPWMLGNFERCLSGEDFWADVHVYPNGAEVKTHYAPLRNGGTTILGMAGCSIIQPVLDALFNRELYDQLKRQLYDS
jgi:PAS domain-containing protein